MPSVDMVMRGFSLTSNEGNFAPCAAYLVRALDDADVERTILYDFGHVGRRLKLQAALQRRGLRPEDIDFAVLSHAHWDHAQNVDLFRSAKVIAGRAELDYLKAPHPGDHATPVWSAALLDNLDVVAGDDGDEILPGVRVLALPGHTAGSTGLAVQTDDGVAVLSGDAVAAAQDALAGICPNVFWDPNEADASIRRSVELADVFYPGHDRPFRISANGSIDYLFDIRELNLAVRDIAMTPVAVTAHKRPTRSLLARAAEKAEATVRAEERQGA